MTDTIYSNQPNNRNENNMTNATAVETLAAQLNTVMNDTMGSTNVANTRAKFRTFPAFAKAVLAADLDDETREYAENVLDAGRNKAGSVALRVSYTFHIVRHGMTDARTR